MIKLRPFEPNDVEVLIALFRETVHRINSHDYTPEQISAWAPNEIDANAWQRRLANQFAVVALIDFKVVGFGTLRDDRYLDLFYVHPDHQKQGVGQTLIDAIEDHARKKQLPQISTESSVTAKPFFERRGFVAIQEQVVECRGTALINYRMTKNLTNAG